MSDWDVGVWCDIYVGVIVWSVKAFHNRTHSLPVVLVKSVDVWILICGKCTRSSSFKVWGSRQLWLDSAFLFFTCRNDKQQMSGFRVASYLPLAAFVCVCAGWRSDMWAIRACMWTSPLRLAALDLWDSHPALCACHVPPFETLMAPAECVTEWVGDNGAGPAASCVPRLPLVPLASKHQGKTTLHMSCSWIVCFDLVSCSPVFLLTRSCATCTVALLLWGWDPFRVPSFQFWTVELRVGWIWQLILLSQDTFWSHGVKNEACFFFYISVWLCKCQHGI